MSFKGGRSPIPPPPNNITLLTDLLCDAVYLQDPFLQYWCLAYYSLFCICALDFSFPNVVLCTCVYPNYENGAIKIFIKDIIESINGFPSICYVSYPIKGGN